MKETSRAKAMKWHAHPSKCSRSARGKTARRFSASSAGLHSFLLLSRYLSREVVRTIGGQGFRLSVPHHSVPSALLSQAANNISREFIDRLDLSGSVRALADYRHRVEEKNPGSRGRRAPGFLPQTFLALDIKSQCSAFSPRACGKPNGFFGNCVMAVCAKSFEFPWRLGRL